jgi:oxalate decarboxylase/phosphoglucose isomerase-like protein (cupin superfamily)
MPTMLHNCSLDIDFDTKNKTIKYGNGVQFANKNKVELQQLSPVLLNRYITYPKTIYEEHIKVCEESDMIFYNNNISHDIFCIPSGLLGIEYIKTHIYYSDYNHNTISSVIEVYRGSITVIMQKSSLSINYSHNNIVEEIHIVTLEIGDKLVIPSGYYYTFINTGERTAIFSRVYKNNQVADYTLLKKERGLAYYCIRKNAKCEVVKNPSYRNTPSILSNKENFNLNKYNLDQDLSLYIQLNDNLLQFETLLS